MVNPVGADTLANLLPRAKLIDADGYPTPQFFQFMTQLWRRTGGAQGFVAPNGQIGTSGVAAQLTDQTQAIAAADLMAMYGALGGDDVVLPSQVNTAGVNAEVFSLLNETDTAERSLNAQVLALLAEADVPRLPTIIPATNTDIAAQLLAGMVSDDVAPVSTGGGGGQGTDVSAQLLAALGQEDAPPKLPTIIPATNTDIAAQLFAGLASDDFVKPGAGTSSNTNALFDLSAGVPPLASFTQIGISGTTSIRQSGTSNSILIADTGKNVVNLVGVTLAVPVSSPYRVAALFMHTGSNTNYTEIEWGWSDGTKFHTMCLVCVNGPTGNFTAESWTNSTTRASNGNVGTVSSGPAGFGTFWVGLRDDGTSVHWEISSDSVNFYSVATQVKSTGFLGATGYSRTFLGLAPDSTSQQFLSVRCYDPNGLNRGFP